MQEGKPAEARRGLEAVLAESPDDARAGFLLALSHHKEKRYTLARAGFERLLERGAGAPEAVEALHFHGWCLYNLGEAATARQSFERHLESRPDAADSHFALGLIELEDGRLDKAGARFTRAIELEAARPDRRREEAKARVRLADVHLARGEPGKAEAEVRRALDLWPAHYAAHHKLALLLFRLGRREEAEEALRLHDEGKRKARSDPEDGGG